MKTLKVGIIGAGNMGGAIARGLLAKKIARPGDIFVADKDKKKEASVARELGVKRAPIEKIAKTSDFMIISVKPQDSEEVLEELACHIKYQTIISVMAGVKIKTINSALGSNVPVVRAMPNMPAKIGKGITCVAFNGRVRDKRNVVKIFSGIGEVVETNEGSLDAVTALSGSGPAYLFYFAESLISAGVKAGLKKDLAEKLAIETLYGASSLLKACECGTTAKLISCVASKGGTTEAALKVFKSEKFKATVERAVARAAARSRELSKR